MARIPPVRGKQDMAPADQHLIDEALDIFGSIRGPTSMLLHSPALAALLLPMVRVFREKCVVADHPRVLGILALVRERHAAYVWSAQVGYARRVGLREDLIDLLRAQGDTAHLPAEERDIVEYARQLARTNRVDQALFDAMLARHGRQWMVEFTTAINFYGMLCGITNAFEVGTPEGGDKLPS
jgi:alkylhydroperoxidase family enzyme